MFKTFSILVVAGLLIFAGGSLAQAATSDCGCPTQAAPAAPATASAPAPRAPASTARPGTQTIRRYSTAPNTYRAPAMRSYRSNSSSGPSWTATRKILGY